MKETVNWKEVSRKDAKGQRRKGRKFHAKMQRGKDAKVFEVATRKPVCK